MAWEDAYATAEEYRTRVRKSSAEDDGAIDAQLLAVSRYFDRKVGQRFTKTATDEARVFDVNPGSTRATVDPLVSLAATTPLAVDSEGDGGYALSVPAGDLILAPFNAASFGEPYRYVRISPVASVLGATWPRIPRYLQVTGVWGWPSVPPAISEAAIAVTRALRDLQEAGYTLTVQNLDAAISVSPTASRIVDDLVKAYRSRAVAF